MRALLWTVPLMMLVVTGAEAKTKCSILDGFYRTIPNGAAPLDTYTQLDFVEFSRAGGQLRFSRYKEGELAWTLDAEHWCRDNAARCGLTLNLEDGSEYSAEYAIFGGMDGTQYVVFVDLLEDIADASYGAFGAGCADPMAH